MASTNSTTVENLNIFDTSSTNDTSGTEIISLQEVLNALFSATNATQTVTIDNVTIVDLRTEKGIHLSGIRALPQ